EEQRHAAGAWLGDTHTRRQRDGGLAQWPTSGRLFAVARRGLGRGLGWRRHQPAPASELYFGCGTRLVGVVDDLDVVTSTAGAVRLHRAELLVVPLALERVRQHVPRRSHRRDVAPVLLELRFGHTLALARRFELGD